MEPEPETARSLQVTITQDKGRKRKVGKIIYPHILLEGLIMVQYQELNMLQHSHLLLVYEGLQI